MALRFLVQNVLAKWRRFWSGVSQSALSREQQLGLFGELWFMPEILIDKPNLVRFEARRAQAPLGQEDPMSAVSIADLRACDPSAPA